MHVIVVMCLSVSGLSLCCHKEVCREEQRSGPAPLVLFSLPVSGLLSFYSYLDESRPSLSAYLHTGGVRELRAAITVGRGLRMRKCQHRPAVTRAGTVQCQSSHYWAVLTICSLRCWSSLQTCGPNRGGGSLEPKVSACSFNSHILTHTHRTRG